MARAFYQLKSSDFEVYEAVNKNGEYSFNVAKDFDMENKEDNVIFFEGKKNRLFGRTRYSRNVKELVTGEKFKIREVRNSESKFLFLEFYSKNLLIKTRKPIRFEENLCSGSRIVGFINFLKENKLYERYVLNVVNFFDYVRTKKDEYLQVCNGPDSDMIRELRDTAKKI